MAIPFRYAVTDIVPGALVLALVTSLPNAVTAVYLARRGRGATVPSTALNSNAINVTAGLDSALAAPVAAARVEHRTRAGTQLAARPRTPAPTPSARPRVAG